MTTQGVVSRSVAPAGGRTPTASDIVKPAGSATYLEVLAGTRHHQTLHLGVIERSLSRAGFSEKASARAASHFRKSSANLYQAK